jgi:arabinose-5-phosphate isomerase
MQTEEILSLARKTIAIEARAIKDLGGFIDKSFAQAVQHIYKADGRVIITGIGKSALIGNKIVATLNSTGTPAVFMHAADAIHGDLGTILKDDIVICISKSGNTPEIKVLVPLIKNFDNKIIAITGSKNSFLGQNADFFLNSFIEEEACPNNLAPTTSTTAQLVIGDALAVCLLELRGFSKNDFARYHPGGALGKKLYLRVGELTQRNEQPQVGPETSVKEVIVEISKKMLGAAAVIDNGKIIGIITDGDLRRMLEEDQDFTVLKARDIMGESPKTISIDTLAVDAMEMMEVHQVSQLIAEENGTYKGIVHIHDLIKEGIL